MVLLLKNKVTSGMNKKNAISSPQKIRFHDRYWSPELLLLSNNEWFLDKSWKYIWFKYENKIYNLRWKHCWWLENWVIRDLQWYSVAFRKWANDGVSPLFPMPWLPPQIWFIRLAPLKPQRMAQKQKPLKRFWWSSLSPLTLFNHE